MSVCMYEWICVKVFEECECVNDLCVYADMEEITEILVTIFK